MRRVRRVVIRFLVISMLGGVAACSSSSAKNRSGSLDVGAVLRTLSQAAYTIRGASSAGARSGRVVGVFGPESTPGRVQFPLLATDEAGIVEMRVLGNHAYLRRARLPHVLSTASGSPLALVGSGPPWIQFDSAELNTPPLRPLIAPYAPSILLAGLSTASRSWRNAGTRTIAGVSAHGSEANLEPGASLGTQRVTVWVAGNRLLRVEADSGDGAHVAYDVAAHSGVVSVGAPRATDISGTGRAGTPRGPFVEAAKGRTAGIDSRILRAAATDGGTCWRVVASPPYVAASGTGPQLVRCVPDTVHVSQPEDSVDVPLDAGALTSYEVVGVLVPSGAAAVGTRADGSTVTLARDPRTGLALYVGPQRPILGYVGVTLRGGTRLACGPGSVTSPDDLTGLDPQRETELRADPWACIDASVAGN